MTTSDDIQSLRERMTRMETWMMDHTNHAGQQFQKNNDDHGLIIERLNHLSELIIRLSTDYGFSKRLVYMVALIIGSAIGFMIKYGGAIIHYIKVKL